MDRQGVTIGQMGAEPGQGPTLLPEMFGGVATERPGTDRHADAMRGHVARHAAAKVGRAPAPAPVAEVIGNAAEDVAECAAEGVEAAYRRGVEDGRAEVRADLIRRLGLAG